MNQATKTVVIDGKKHLKVDYTAMRLFCQLLKHARHLKKVMGYGKGARRLYLAGMITTMHLNREDFQLADGQRDRWIEQGSYAYNNNGGNDW